MNIQEILSHVDHTLLKQESTWKDIQGIVDDGIRYQTASVCIPSSFVKAAAEYARGRAPKTLWSSIPAARWRRPPLPLLR